MKITLFKFTILLFSLQLTAQTPSFLGKWVEDRYEFYRDGNLDYAGKYEVANKTCPSYTEFTNEGIMVIQNYNSSCEEESVTTRTYKHKGNLLELTDKDGWYNDAIIKIIDNKLQLIMMISESEKMIMYYDNYDTIFSDIETKKKFYENGEVSSTTTYKNGERNGDSKIYNKQGQLEKVELYANGILINENLKEVDLLGKWVFIKTELYLGELLAAAESNELNKDCIAFMEFKNDQSYSKTDYSADCAHQKPITGTYTYTNNQLTIIPQEGPDGENTILTGTIVNYSAKSFQMIVKIENGETHYESTGRLFFERY